MSDTRASLGDLSSVKLALMAKTVRAEALAVLSSDPIAIVGMACRVPGADSPANFWTFLSAGEDAIREVPPDRWNADRWFDPDPAAVAKSSTKWGGFLDRIDEFDAAYFGILPREAERMDPQQRVFLELAIEALDDAGLPRRQLRGSRTGVFVASYQNDYALLQYDDLEAIDARTLTGTLHSVLANRLSHFLDLRGPSISIDTACSSSLVAVHLACQSLRLGESDVAIAGGVSLMITPELMIALSKVGFMAPDGRCRTFDVNANGFGRGEGCGVVVCKRLADAIADGDRILAVLRGSAVNQDGHSTVLAAPNGLAQRAMILDALSNARLPAGRIGFVEAHGTGTALGDPIEVEALAATIGMDSSDAGPCFLGAVKANIGHLEAAAGVIGMIKAILCLQHGQVPPQPNFTALNPYISLANTRLVIPTKMSAWPRRDLPRCAAVSSFGVGGTNAHVILEEAPALPHQTANVRSGILPLSAHSPGALRTLAKSWLTFLDETSAAAADICYTASRRRSHFDHRLALVGRSKDEFRSALVEWLESDESLVTSRHRPEALRVAFVFSGQGPQWYAMGRELLHEEPVFRAIVSECDACLRPLAGWSLLEELNAPEHRSRVGMTEVAQPALFAVQVALAALWKSWGLVPTGVVGHSVGEIAALHVAGVLTLEDAVRVVWHRGHLMQQATGFGRMCAVSMSAADAGELVGRFDNRLSVAAINGPRSVVISGDAAALEHAIGILTASGIQHRMVPVDYAFHSPQMEAFQPLLSERLASVTLLPPNVSIYSTVTGTPVRTTDRFDRSYFARNMREPVRFGDAITAAANDGLDAYVEIGPHPVLGAAISESLDAAMHSALTVASLRRQRPERQSMLAAAARLYVAGWMPNWAAMLADGDVSALPRYPWQRQRFWLRERSESTNERRELVAGGHPLLGARIAAAGIDAQIFEGSSAAADTWLFDHRVFGRVAMPGAAMLELLLAGARVVVGDTCQLTAVAIHRPLFVPERGCGRRRWQTVVKTNSSGRAELSIYEEVSDADDGNAQWREVASASASHRDALALLANDQSSLLDSAEGQGLYQQFEALGVSFGPTFRCLADIKRGEGSVEAWIDLPAELLSEATRHLLHPVLIDAGLQLCSLLAPDASAGGLPGQVLLPLGADRFDVLHTAPSRLLTRVRLRERGLGGSLCADVLFESDGIVIAAIEGMRFAPADAKSFGARERSHDDALYEVIWSRLPKAAVPMRNSGRGRWLVFCDRAGVADRVCDHIEAAGGESVRVRPGDRYASTSPDTYTVNPINPRDFERLLAESRATDLPFDGVVHAWSLDLALLLASTEVDDQDALSAGSLLHLVQSLIGNPCPVWVVTRGAQVVNGQEPETGLRPLAAGVWGLSSVIAIEHPELGVRCIDLDPSGGADADALVAELHLDGESSIGPKRSVALRDGERWAPRLEHWQAARRRPNEDRALRVELVRPGTLDGVEVRPVERVPLKRGEVRLRVLAAGINFRDLLMTLGMYEAPGCPLGVECVGVVTEIAADVRFVLGSRVFGYAPGGLGTEVVVPAAFLADVPDNLSTEEAASVPVAFLTAYYGLHRLAALVPGQRVLIHAAAGGVGLAAVQLALRSGADVFATAGSPDKRALLQSMGVAHVMDSRSLGFADEIRALTAGEGVDVVLNSLAGEYIAESLKIVRPGGVFLELGKRGVLTPEAAANERPDVRYHLFDLGAEAQADHGLLRPMFDDLLAYLARGEVRPLPVTVYPLGEVREALRLMAQSKHVGKIVLRVASDAAADRPLVSSAGTYWITGAFGGLGLETARWLARSGARTLVMTGRRPPSGVAAQTIAELQNQGITVRAIAADAGDRHAMRAVAAEIRRELPPLRGVVHAAAVLQDAVLVRQTWTTCKQVLRAKAHGGWILDALTRDLPLDFFVLYSAAGTLLGAAGQGVYPAANAELDALARARRRSGLPALSVAWGAWTGVGMMAAPAQRGRDLWAGRGLGSITAPAGFSYLERLLRDDAVAVAAMPIDWRQFLAGLPSGCDRSLFAKMGAADVEAPSGTTTPVAAWLEQLRALPVAQRREALTVLLLDRARQILGFDSSVAVDRRLPLKEVGLDSLMAVELRNAVARSIGRPLPATLLFDYPTVDAMVGHLMRELSPKGQEDETLAPGRTLSPSELQVSAVAGLSEDEAEALLLKEIETTPRSAHVGSS